MSNFYQAIGLVLENEGSEFVPEDKGRGASKYGITLKTYQEWHPQATTCDIRTMDAEKATEFYRHWWERYHFGLIDDQTLATKVFDLSVNDGPGTAVELLQRALHIEEDGILGPLTAKAANDGSPGLHLDRLRRVAEEHYRAVVKARPEDEPELAGWLARLAKDV